MTDEKADQVINIFKDAGIQIEPGARYSVRGQIAGLLYGCKKLIDSGIISSCPLYTDYKKSCRALKEHRNEAAKCSKYDGICKNCGKPLGTHRANDSFCPGIGDNFRPGVDIDWETAPGTYFVAT